MLLDRVVHMQPLMFQARFELAMRLGQRAVELLMAAPPASIPKTDLGEAAMMFIQNVSPFCKNLKVPKRLMEKS
jgi:hypothetical protein